jgi:hypothetical protein
MLKSIDITDYHKSKAIATKINTLLKLSDYLLEDAEKEALKAIKTRLDIKNKKFEDMLHEIPIIGMTI